MQVVSKDPVAALGVLLVEFLEHPDEVVFFFTSRYRLFQPVIVRLG